MSDDFKARFESAIQRGQNRREQAANQSRKAEMTEEECRNILMQSAQPSPLVQADENGHHPKYGYGIVNTARILQELFPEDFEEDVSKSSGCSHTNSSAWLFFLSIFLLLTRRE